MGSRSFPVPFYTTTSQLNGTTRRALSTTSPGTTDSTASTVTPALALGGGSARYNPEAAFVASNPITVGVAADGRGWGISPAQLGLLAADGFVLDAGTLTFTVHFSRDNPLLSGDWPGSVFTAGLAKSNTAFSSFGNFLAVGSSAAVTVTTTEQSVACSISIGSPITFAPGETLWFEIHVNLPASVAVATSACRLHTNSSTATRITAAPAYTINYNRALADSATAVTETLTRLATYRRDLADSAPVADVLTRVASHPRQLADSAPASDALQRLASYFRRLDDAPGAVTDSLQRLATYSRMLADSAPAADSLDRRLSYFRRLADSAPGVTDTLSRVYQANRRLADSVPVPADAIARYAMYGRFLNDSAPAADLLTRVVTYRRYLEDDLTSGVAQTLFFAVLD